MQAAASDGKKPPTGEGKRALREDWAALSRLYT